MYCRTCLELYLFLVKDREQPRSLKFILLEQSGLQGTIGNAEFGTHQEGVHAEYTEGEVMNLNTANWVDEASKPAIYSFTCGVFAEQFPSCSG